jgi:propionyl-coA carboxylase, beta subunit
MDKIKLLQTRRSKVLEAGSEIRKTISELVDADSFVELSGYSFSKNEFYGEDAEGEGVVTGFATVEGYPVYVAAQNFKVMSGGVSKANCEKILKCLTLAEKNSTPVVYILNSLGVQVGEGVTVLEGLASVLAKSARLHGVVPQFTIVKGEVYGQAALFTANADFNFFLKEGVLAANSPLVISAKSGKNLPKEEVGGAKALDKTNLVSFTAENMAEIRSKIFKIIDLLPDYNSVVVENGADLNRANAKLNQQCSSDELVKAVFDAESFVEVGNAYSPEVKCILGRVGGVSVAAVVFDGEEGTELDQYNMAKINWFLEFAAYYSLPFISFADTLSVAANTCVNNSLVLKQISKFMENFELLENAKISVVYKKAVGMGYTLFAAKSMGYDYTLAFANAKIALFDSVAGAEIELAADGRTREKLAEKYADENSDPVNAAKDGYIDDIIEPQFVKQYLIAALQMLLK